MGHTDVAVPWSHADQVLAAIQVIYRANASEISNSALVESNVDVGRMLDQLVRTGRVVQNDEQVGPMTYSVMAPDRRRLVPVEGNSTASRLLRLVKQNPGWSGRQLSRELGYMNPGSAVSVALRRLMDSGQVRRVIDSNRHRYYATGRDQ